METLIINFFLMGTLIFVITICYLSSKLSALDELQPFILGNSIHLRKSQDVPTAIYVSKLKEGSCVDYGCPIHSQENTDDVKQEIVRWTNLLSNDSAVSTKLPYGSIHYCGLTQKGLSHEINQDRGLIVYPFYHTIGNQSLARDQNNFICAIFDGHGATGEKIAHNLQQNFPNLLYIKLSQQIGTNDSDISDDLVKQILKETFLELDQELDPEEAEVSGSTASIVLRVRNKLYFANVGDSTCMLVAYNTTVEDHHDAIIVHTNRIDKPSIPEEKDRIERLGGKVFIPNPFNARVVAFSKALNEPVSLGMSRSIGDWPHSRVGVISEPTIDIVDLQHFSQPGIGMLVISGSDGIYDHRRPQFVANRLAKSLFDSHPSENNIVSETFEVLRSATPTNPLGYRDDMTILGVRILL